MKVTVRGKKLEIQKSEKLELRGENYYKKFLLPRGFTLIEVTLVVSLFFILIAISTVNLFQFQHKSQLSGTVSSFLADYKEQQIKAMVGDTEGNGVISDYGVHLETTTYTLFRSTYGISNFAVSLPSNIQITTTFPSSQVVFQKGSGTVSGFTIGQNTITLQDTSNNTQKVITINRYGVVTAVN